MQGIIGWDTETHLIEDGNLTPKLVCATFSGGSDTLDAARHFAILSLDSTNGFIQGERVWEMLVRADKVVDAWCYFVQQGYSYVAHNHPFDLGVLINHCPDILPVVIDLMEKGRLRDTQIREKLIAIADDNFNFDNRINKKPGGFSLAYLAELYFSENLYEDKKDPNS